MADKAHLEILRRGVDAWNQWRRDNPRIKPDFSSAIFRMANLIRVDLHSANLSGADLSVTDLHRADLTGADLTNADLRAADLTEAQLTDADLREAKLREAHLSGAVLHRVDLSRADLNKANLREANLREADLGGASLIGVDLGGTYLNGASLIGADLGGTYLSGGDLRMANLSEAYLRGADLTETICERANFSNVDLTLARLLGANLDGATLTGARLWETQRAGWSVKGVVCESVYWDEGGKELTTYGPGDFERLYSDKTKIILFYQGGLSLLEFSALPALVKHLEETRPGCTLRLESINDASGGAVVTLAIDEAGDSSPEGLTRLKAKLETAAAQVIEYQRKALAERETRLRLEGEVKQLGTVVEKLIFRPSLSFHSQAGITVGDKYNVGQAGAVGPQSHAHDMTFNQIGGNIESRMDLTQLARELATLRQAMKGEATEPAHDAAVGKVAKAEQAAKTQDSSKVAEALKGAGKWALDVATKIGTTLASEALKESLGMK